MKELTKVMLQKGSHINSKKVQKNPELQVYKEVLYTVHVPYKLELKRRFEISCYQIL